MSFEGGEKGDGNGTGSGKGIKRKREQEQEQQHPGDLYPMESMTMDLDNASYFSKPSKGDLLATKVEEIYEQITNAKTKAELELSSIQSEFFKAAERHFMAVKDRLDQLSEENISNANPTIETIVKLNHKIASIEDEMTQFRKSMEIFYKEIQQQKYFPEKELKVLEVVTVVLFISLSAVILYIINL